MDEQTRIEKDVIMFEENTPQLENKELSKAQKKTVELAKQYFEDSKYYLEKKDYFTSFGCINYAHGVDCLFRENMVRGKESNNHLLGDMSIQIFNR